MASNIDFSSIPLFYDTTQQKGRLALSKTRNCDSSKPLASFVLLGTKYARR